MRKTIKQPETVEEALALNTSQRSLLAALEVLEVAAVHGSTNALVSATAEEHGISKSQLRLALKALQNSTEGKLRAVMDGRATVPQILNTAA